MAGGLLALLLLAGVALAASMIDFGLAWNAIVGGGGRSSSAAYVVEGSAGQPAADTLSSAGFRLESGFWPGTGAQPGAPTPTGSPAPTTTATATATAPPLPTATATPTGAPCEVLPPHGDFEAGLLPPWNAVGEAQISTAKAYGGTQSVRLGGGNSTSSELFTGLELPPHAVSMTFSYWWYVESSDPDPAADIVVVLVGDGSGEMVVETLTNESPRDGWHQTTFDVSGYAGGPMNITFHAETNEAHVTSFYVDDVQVAVCGGAPVGQHIYLPVVLQD
jgi:hypothetical protein